MSIEIKPRKSLAFAKVATENPDLPLAEQARIVGINPDYARQVRSGRVRPPRPHKPKSVATSD